MAITITGASAGCAAVVIGGSAGSRPALAVLLGELPPLFPAGIAVVTHLHAHSDVRELAHWLAQHCRLTVREALPGMRLEPGTVSLAPANYHLLVEANGCLALSIDPKVNFSRPSIDVLFETAADTFGAALAGVVLSGASRDGIEGLLRIRKLGGITLVQEPRTAEVALMPQSAIDAGIGERVFSPEKLGRWLASHAVRDLRR